MVADFSNRRFILTVLCIAVDDSWIFIREALLGDTVNKIYILYKFCMCI